MYVVTWDEDIQNENMNRHRQVVDTIEEAQALIDKLVSEFPRHADRGRSISYRKLSDDEEQLEIEYRSEQ